MEVVLADGQRKISILSEEYSLKYHVASFETSSSHESLENENKIDRLERNNGVCTVIERLSGISSDRSISDSTHDE